jgi:hypothetical protein
MNWKRIGLFALVALVLYGVISSPHTSAANVHVGVSKLGDAADNVGTFVQGVFK